MPRLVPFKQSRALGGVAGRTYVEPMTTYRTNERADEALRFSDPWCTMGQVLVGYNLGTRLWSGSGVLVGRNLVLTASHVAPWNRAPGQWWMRFVPGRRITNEPHGSSYVESFYGTYSDVNNFEASGKDYVICKLYTPLGNALGWMGSRSFGSEDDYYNRRFISVGYPGYFGDRPAVDYDIDIDDIDSDSPGLELETTYPGSPEDDGWSGGPLWMWENESPFVVGILSGSEKDELDPRRHVWGAGGLLVIVRSMGLRTGVSCANHTHNQRPDEDILSPHATWADSRCARSSASTASWFILSGPRRRRGPWLGVGFDRIRAAVEEQLHERQLSPAARPPERRALQQVIANVEPRAAVKDRGCEGHSLFRCHVSARDDVVQRRQSKLLLVCRTSAQVGIAAFEQQAKAREIGIARSDRRAD